VRSHYVFFTLIKDALFGLSCISRDIQYLRLLLDRVYHDFIPGTAIISPDRVLESFLGFLIIKSVYCLVLLIRARRPDSFAMYEWRFATSSAGSDMPPFDIEMI